MGAVSFFICAVSNSSLYFTLHIGELFLDVVLQDRIATTIKYKMLPFKQFFVDKRMSNMKSCEYCRKKDNCINDFKWFLL